MNAAERQQARDQFIREVVFQQLALVLDLTDEAWLRKHLFAAFDKAARDWARVSASDS